MAREDAFFAKIAAGEAFMRAQIAANPGISFNELERRMKAAGVSFGSRQEKQGVFRNLTGREKTHDTEAARKGGRRSGRSRQITSIVNKITRKTSFRKLPAATQDALLSDGAGGLTLRGIVAKLLNERDAGGSARRVKFRYLADSHTFLAILEGDEPDMDDFLELEDETDIQDAENEILGNAVLAHGLTNQDLADFHAFMTDVFDAVGL